MTKILCIYHANCCDGFASAWAVHRKFGDAVDFVAVNYGDGPPRKMIDKDRDVLIVDFSYPRPVLEEMSVWARSVLVLDHHKTAAEQLAGLPGLEHPMFPASIEHWLHYGGMIDRGADGCNLAACFDMERSGAGITLDVLTGGDETTRPRLIDLVEDHDLWRFKHDPDTRRFHAVAASYGYEAIAENFNRWDDWHFFAEKDQDAKNNGADGVLMWQVILREGEAIIRAQAKMLEGTLASTHRTMRIAGHVVPCANVPGALASEAGNLLCVNDVTCRSCRGSGTFGPEPCTDCLGTGTDPEYDVAFSATYYDGADSKRHFSLRSSPSGADVGKIAQRYGGGGHFHSSGFDKPIGWEGD